jgi:hypothetical protein
MTITVPGMRSNKSVNMDIDQLREWASLMDKAMIASLVTVILAVTALGITTFLSIRYGSAVRPTNRPPRPFTRNGARPQLNGMLGARERAAALEQEMATARGRTAVLEHEVSTARERAVAITARAALAETARAPALDPAAIRQRLADLGKLIKDAATRTPEPTQEPVASKAAEPAPPIPVSGAPESATATPSAPPSPFVASLRKFAGTKAALFLLGQVSDAPAIGAALSTDLSEAGWAPQTWTWGGVAGIFGIVVLVRDGSDPTTHEAASALVESLLSAGFNATKGDWPANWGRFRGTLNGPPGPTDAAIRIVVGSKARGPS